MVFVQKNKTGIIRTEFEQILFCREENMKVLALNGSQNKKEVNPSPKTV